MSEYYTSMNGFTMIGLKLITSKFPFGRRWMKRVSSQREIKIWCSIIGIFLAESFFLNNAYAEKSANTCWNSNYLNWNWNKYLRKIKSFKIIASNKQNSKARNISVWRTKDNFLSQKPSVCVAQRIIARISRVPDVQNRSLMTIIHKVSDPVVDFEHVNLNKAISLSFARDVFCQPLTFTISTDHWPEPSTFSGQVKKTLRPVHTAPSEILYNGSQACLKWDGPWWETKHVCWGGLEATLP